MITLDYTKELYEEICNSFTEYYQTGYTVCGAQDPAVIYLGEDFIRRHPQLKEYNVVRVIDKYLNEWNSATLLEFSNNDVTDEENEFYEKFEEEENEGGE